MKIIIYILFGYMAITGIVDLIWGGFEKCGPAFLFFVGFAMWYIGRNWHLFPC